MSDEVCLTIPAHPSFITLARMVAAGMSARAGFTHEEVEDLRLALDELCFSLIGLEGEPGSVQLHYRIDDTYLAVDACSIRVEGQGQIHSTEFSQALLDALVDDHGAEESGDPGPVVWLRKRHHGDKS